METFADEVVEIFQGLIPDIFPPGSHGVCDGENVFQSTVYTRTVQLCSSVLSLLPNNLQHLSKYVLFQVTPMNGLSSKSGLQ